MSKFPHILSSILRGYWLMEESAVNAHLPLAIKLMNGEPVSFEDNADSKPAPLLPLAVYKLDPTTGSIFVDLQAGENVFRNVPAGTLAVIPVKGVIMKEDWCGSPGTKTLASWVKQANEAPNISAIILDVEGPGGSVNGTPEFFDVIRNSQKPVVSFVEGMAASASYWIASGAKEIIASHESTMIGSIGTMISLLDDTKRLKMLGYKRLDIYADKSTDKNQSFAAAIKGNEKPLKNELLNPLNEIFHRGVMQSREGKLNISETNEPLTGKVYLGKDAISLGLIDSIGSFEDAIDRAYELANKTVPITEEKPNSNQITNNTMKKTLISAWTVACAVFGVSFSAEETSKEVDITDEQFKQLAEKAESLNSELVTANGTIQTVTQERDNFKTQIDSLTAEKETLTARVTELDKLPGATQSNPAKNGNDVVETEKEEFLTQADHDARKLKAEIGN